MYLIIDNTKDINTAKMTPLLIEYMKDRKKKHIMISGQDELYEVISKYKSELKGVILSGGPFLLSQKTELYKYSKNFTALIEFQNIPVLGICFGYQVMSMAYGGIIKKLEKKKSGIEEVSIDHSVDIFYGLSRKIKVYQSHKDYLDKCPDNFDIIAMNEDNKIEGIQNIEKKRYGFQFHPEKRPEGHKIIDNFIKICEGS